MASFHAQKNETTNISMHKGTIIIGPTWIQTKKRKIIHLTPPLKTSQHGYKGATRIQCTENSTFGFYQKRKPSLANLHINTQPGQGEHTESQKQIAIQPHT